MERRETEDEFPLKIEQLLLQKRIQKLIVKEKNTYTNEIIMREKGRSDGKC